MKRIIAIAIVLVICVFGGFYLFDILKLNKEDYEFTSFQSFLNENFFPVLNDTFKHFDQAADELEDDTFLEWYLNLDGLEENEAFQKRVVNTERIVFDEEVNGTSTLSLKKNILEQIDVLQETLDLLYDAAEVQAGSTDELHQAFTVKIEELSNLSEVMNTIMEANDEVEEAGSF